MSVLDNVEPKLVWKHFDEIRKIPRCSKHEEKIREYIVNFGKKQGLQVKTDKAGNVLISKPAAPGVKNKPVMILQGHMDMVCEKNSDVVHDFSKDPIKLKRDGDTLSAEGTTLGADNGIGVATSLALLEDNTVKHGPLEAVFTIDEETGLTGAFAMDPSLLTGKTMLNLDSEEFGILTVGCAGGGDTKIELPIKTQPVAKDMVGVIVKISGLRGGHSGVNIHEQRGNAIKVLARVLWKNAQCYSFSIKDIRGGDKHNAIPREAMAILAVHKNDRVKFSAMVKAEGRIIADEIKPIDPDLKVDVEDSKTPTTTLEKISEEKLVHLLHGLPHGVQKMSYEISTLVQTSTNLAVVALKEDHVFIHMSSRSSVKSELQDIRDRIKTIALLSGAKVSEETPYPGWKPDLDSKILGIARKVYKELYKQDPKVEAVHAGLECGIIGEKFPGMDMISIGPTIKYLHSPQEQTSISSVEKMYRYIGKILESV